MTRALVAVVVLLAGCLRVFAPDVGSQIGDGGATGDGATAGCSDAPANPGFTVSFATNLRNGVFQHGRCSNCHTGDGIGLSQSGLDLSSYTTLLAGGGRSSTNIVLAGKPCTSVLFQKIGPAPPFGRRMPYDGPPYLSDADIQLVHDWIAEGALDN